MYTVCSEWDLMWSVLMQLYFFVQLESKTLKNLNYINYYDLYDNARILHRGRSLDTVKCQRQSY